MKIKKVNRYYCDFCKKANCSRPSISKHEKRCTMNPNRYCGMCALVEEEQKPIEELLSILPNPDLLVKKQTIMQDFISEDWSAVRKEMGVAFPVLRERANNCPVCIMAALRQRKIPVPIANELGYDFKKECDAIWATYNEEQMRQEYENERRYL